MRFTVLGSGSTGNAAILSSGTTNVLIDAGMSCREICKRLAAVGISHESLDGILITHEHSDHIAGLRVLAGAVKCSIYISRLTEEALYDWRYIGRNGTTETEKRRAALAGRFQYIESDKGEAIVISGRVFQPDGKTVAPNTLIYLYHTDFEGYYGRKPSEHKHGKYRGWMLTDNEGRYSFMSVKPAPYPENRFAAHIHMTVTTPTAKEDWIDSILFEGDRLISSHERTNAGKRGGFNPILTLKKGEGGLLHGTRDIQLM